MSLSQILTRRPGLGLLGPDDRAPQSLNNKDWDFDMLGLPQAGDEVLSADLRPYVVSVLNQGRTSTCVANAWEQALRIERGVQGYPVELGSRLFGYSNSRAEHGAEKKDAGTYLRTYAYALKKVGNLSEDEWEFKPRRVNRTPPPRCYRKAWAFRGIRGYYKIHDLKARRTQAIRAALAKKKPLVFGVSIDRAFQNSTGADTVGIPRGEIIGGHAMAVVGFEVDPSTGEFRYLILNSWGDDWREAGYIWFTEEHMQWYALQDIWAVSLV